MIDIKVDTSGGVKKLKTIEVSAQKPNAGFWHFVEERLGQLIQLIFRSQGQYGGRPRWAALAPSTVNAPITKKHIRGTKNILFPNGTFLRSFKKIRQTASSLLFGSQMRVGRGFSLSAIHHLGASFTRPAIHAKNARALKFWSPRTGGFVFQGSVGPARVNIPARPHVYFHVRDTSAISAEYKKFILGPNK